MEDSSAGDPPGLDHALSLLKKATRLVLKRLPAVVELNFGIAFVRAPWWDKGKFVGIARTDEMRYAPAVSEWLERIEQRTKEVEEERKASPLGGLLDRADAQTRAFGNIVVVDLERNAAEGMTSISSGPFRVHGYDMIAIVECDQASFDRFKPGQMNNKQEQAGNPLGLLEASIRSCLEWITNELSHGLSDWHNFSQGDVDAILRRAGSTVCSSAQNATEEGPFLGPDLFLGLDSISALTYEGEGCTGTIALMRADRVSSLQPLLFKEPIALSDAALVRKLLETTAPPFVVATNRSGLNGLVSIDQKHQNCTDFYVRFTGQHRWRLNWGDQPIMDCRFGFPALPSDGLSVDHFSSTFRRVFTDAEEELTAIWPIVQETISSLSGALLVVTRDAEAEAARLAEQSTPIVPRRLLPGEAKNASKIDGAVILEPDGICHAIGAILDGPAVDGGSRSRGARFNSALRYVRANIHSLAIVKSEDGHIDLLPRLRPAIKQSVLEDDLNVVRATDTKSRRSAATKARAERLITYADVLNFIPGDKEKTFRCLQLDFDLGFPSEGVPEFDRHFSDILPEDK